MTRTARTDDQGQRDPAPTRQPGWLEPELATLTADRFSDPAWIFERKFDGERCLAFRDGEQLRLVTRNRQQVTGTYPEIAEALRAQDAADFIVDGEVVAFDGDQTSFSRLQRRLGVRDPGPALLAEVPVYIYLFDVLWADGRDVRPRPLLRAQAPCCATCCRSVTRCASPSTGTATARRTTRSVPPGLGGAHRQARRRALPGRPHPGLAEVQVPERPGVRHRRLHRPAGIPHRVRRAAARLLRPRRQAALRRQGRHRLRPAHADQPARGPGRPRAAGPALRARPRPAPIRRCTGSSPSLSPRSASASGPRTGNCATPGSRACAGTRTPPTSCGKCHEVTVVMRVLDERTLVASHNVRP